jgi:putative hemolysin
MSRYRLWGMLLVVVMVSLLAACGAPAEQPSAGDVADMPNPASAYCEEQAGRVEMRTDSRGGTHGVCVFGDGSECDEWAFYRGECQPGDMDRAPEPEGSQSELPNPASAYCEEQAGSVEMRTDSRGGTYGVCVFDDGSECDEWAFYRGECQPGQMQTAPEPGS